MGHVKLQIGVLMTEKNILGVNLCLRTLREALSHSDFLMGNGPLGTIHYISTRMLIQASRQEEVKQLLENTDMLVCAETDILRAAGINSGSRLYEVENHLFLKELCRRIHRSRERFYLLSDTAENLGILTGILSDCLGELPLNTCQTLEQLQGDEELLSTEALANEINDVAPAIIISNLPFPYQLQLMYELKPFLNARLWLGLPSEAMLLKPSRFSFSAFRKLWQKYFHKKVNHYQEMNSSDISAF